MEDSKQITKDSLIQFVLNNDDHISADDALHIVSIFGGIQQVLLTYLQSQNMSLNNHQLMNIQQILLSTSTNKQQLTPKSMPLIKSQNYDKNGQNDAENGAFFCHTFDPNNHSLNTMFNKQNVKKITKFVTTSRLSILVMISLIFYAVLRAVSVWLGLISANIWKIYALLIRFMFHIPLLIIVILLLNIKAFKLVRRSFDYWIKSVYAIMYEIAIFVYLNRGANLLQMTEYISGAICVLLLVVFVASFDAMPNLKRKWKAILSAMFAVWFSVQVINYTFIKDENEDYIISVQVTNSHISLQSLIASFSRIIAIFMWKQTINVIRRKRKCVSITYKPYIEWKEGNNDALRKNDKTETLYDGVMQDTDNVNAVEMTHVQTMRIGMKENESSLSTGCSNDENCNLEI